MNNNNKKLRLLKDTSQLSDSSTASTKAGNTPKSKPDTKISFTSEINSKRNGTYIKEVYQDNLLEELGVISELLDEYNYIGMDSEFPGTVFNINNITNDFYYKSMKVNVDSLKLIQLGITLTNENGEFPKNIPYHTWQFNFQFDIQKDFYNENSIKLLKNSGINFEKLKKNGIKHQIFAEYLITSGLVLNPDIYWISFHGSYDFGYLLKLLTNENLPLCEENFNRMLELYFPNYYDVKILIKDLDYYFNGGLNKLIFKLGVIRKGIMHQAGSDSIATIETFFALINYGIITDGKIKKLKNVLYGLGIGQDNENTIHYTNLMKCNNNNNLSPNNNNNNIITNNNNISCACNCNCNCNTVQTNYNNIYSQNIKPQPTNCNNNIKVNWFCPFFLVNSYGILKNNALINNMNCKMNSI